MQDQGELRCKMPDEIFLLQIWDSLCFKFRTNTFYSAAIYKLQTIQRSNCVFADVLAACDGPLSLSSSPSSMGDQSCYSVDQSFWSAQIIGIAEISMRWWMIDNATTVIDCGDIADKTHLQQPLICNLQVHPTFLCSMGKNNIVEQLLLFHCVVFFWKSVLKRADLRTNKS